LRVLLIRLREIGDVVFTTPVIRAVRQRFPAAYLAYLVEPGAAPVVAGNPHLDEVIVAPRRRGFGGLRQEAALVRRLRAGAFDLVIDLHGGPRASILAWLSGAPARIGYEVVGRAWMYTQRVPRARALRPRHSVENQWDLLASLYAGPPDRASYPVEMPVDPEAADRVATRLRDAGIGTDHRLVVIHVSAGNPFRRWPVESFAALAAAIAREDACHRVVLTSGPSEQYASRQVLAAARAALEDAERTRLLDCGEFSLAELRALVDRAALFIGGDSGPMHIAATSPVPIVGLYGPTLPARSAPWRSPLLSEPVETLDLPCRPCDQRVCAPGDFRCLTRIQPQQVVTAAVRLLRRSGGNMEPPRTAAEHP
jgi:lipopolysaccharide heptosyltransferase II